MHALIIDTPNGVLVLDTAGYFTHVDTVRTYQRLGRIAPKPFTHRKHAWQFLATRAAGWHLGTPEGLGRGSKYRILSTRTLGLEPTR